MKNFLKISEENKDFIRELLESLLRSEEASLVAAESMPALIFFEEASTRTRLSFERAFSELEIPFSSVSRKNSSLEKKESIEDSFLNFRSLGYKVIVFRSGDESLLKKIKKIGGLHFINAGLGVDSHPTQALLDFLTLLESFGSFEKIQEKKISIIGDLRHSRVAQSFFRLAKLFNLQVSFVAPEEWKPSWLELSGEITFSTDKTSVHSADTLMALRVQKERHSQEDQKLLENYIKNYQLNKSDFAKNQFLLHPGPVNWGVELHEELKNYSHNLILKQVQNGLRLRKALLVKLLG